MISQKNKDGESSCSFCASKKKIEIALQVVEYQNKEKEADTLFKKGSYTCLKEAFQIYHGLLDFE